MLRRYKYRFAASVPTVEEIEAEVAVRLPAKSLSRIPESETNGTLEVSERDYVEYDVQAALVYLYVPSDREKGLRVAAKEALVALGGVLDDAG